METSRDGQPTASSWNGAGTRVFRLHNHRRVRQLPDETAASVRAGQVIGSLSRAVEELVRNSVEHGRSTSVVVTVGSKHNGTMAYLQVQDDGCGIDPKPVKMYLGTENCSSVEVIGRDGFDDGDGERHEEGRSNNTAADESKRRRTHKRSGGRKRSRLYMLSKSSMPLTSRQSTTSTNGMVPENLHHRSTENKSSFSSHRKKKLKTSTRGEDSVGSTSSSAHSSWWNHHPALSSYSQRGETLKALGALSSEMRICTRFRALHFGHTKVPKCVDSEAHKKNTGANSTSSSKNDFRVICSRKIIRRGSTVDCSTTWKTDNEDSSYIPRDGGLQSHRLLVDSATSLESRRIRNDAFENGKLPTNTQNEGRGGTGTTIYLEGLFHTHAVRKRHQQRERQKASTRQTCVVTTTDGTASNIHNRHEEGSNNADIYAGERADVAQVRACIRTMALTYPMVSFTLLNGRRGVTVATWAVSLAVKGGSSQHYSTSLGKELPSCASSFHRQRQCWTAALRCRLRQVCGNALSDGCSDSLLMPIVISEDDSSTDRSVANRSSAAVSSSVIAAESRAVCRWNVSGIVVHPTALQSTESKLVQSVYVNGRPFRHVGAMAKTIQSSFAFESSTSGDDVRHTPCFVVHVSAPHQEVDLVIEEERSTVTVTRSDFMEQLLWKACAQSFATRTLVERTSCLSETKVFQEDTFGGLAKESNGVGARKSSHSVASRLVSGRQLKKEDVCHSPFFVKSRKKSPTVRPAVSLPSPKENASALLPGTSPFSTAFFDESQFEDFAGEVSTSADSTSAARPQGVEKNEKSSGDGDRSDGPSSPMAGDDLGWTRQRVSALESQISTLALPPLGRPSHERSVAVTKDMLSRAIVISQVDAKFIIVNAGGVVCVVDQHAADERVRLERLERQLADEMIGRATTDADAPFKGTVLRRIDIPDQTLRLTPSHISIVQEHDGVLARWGFTCAIKTGGDASCVIALTGVPSVCDKQAGPRDFMDFVAALGNAKADAKLRRPPFVHRVLASYACRYAIMFGDELEPRKSEELISDLSLCDLSFVCAHGRPSVIPLVDMSQIEVASTKRGCGKRSTGVMRSVVSVRDQPRRIVADKK